MYVVLGASGHVGGAVARALLVDALPVTAVVRDAGKADALKAAGAEVVEVDIGDAETLRAVLRRGRRAFLLNPPAAPAIDTNAQETRTVDAIAAALEDSRLERVVAASTYGAQPGDRLGDLSVLHRFERLLRAQTIPATCQRGAYYMSNWDAALETAREEGVVHTLFPIDFALPMVAPADLGAAAARLLTQAHRPSLHWVEGPARRTSADVAQAFAAALGRPVKAAATPRAEWREAFKAQGFSDTSADAYVRMTDAAMAWRPPDPSEVERGPTSLEAYIARLVAG